MNLEIGWYETAFRNNLHRLLWEHNDPASRVVAFANITYSPEMLNQSNLGDLNDVLAWCKRSHGELMVQGQAKPMGVEDGLVLNHLEEKSISRSLCSKEENRQGLVVAYAPIRSFRPAGAAAEVVTSSLPESYDQEKDAFFHRTFLKKECFWDDTLGGKRVMIFHNKFPFVSYHGLIIPENQPQVMTEEWNEWIWNVLDNSKGEFVVGFNSLGGYASKKQMHFQISTDPREFGLFDPTWKHNGGKADFPPSVEIFGDRKDAGKWVREAIRDSSQRAHNLVYVPGRLYAFSREFQGTIDPPDWSSGFAYAEMAGRAVTSTADGFLDASMESWADHVNKISIVR